MSTAGELALKEYGHYIDFVPSRDIYNNQKVIKLMDAALSFALTSMYSRRELLPQLEGMFVEVERFRHSLDSIAILQHIKSTVEENLNSIMIDYTPTLELTYDRDTGRLDYTIQFYGKGELKVTNGATLTTASFKINNKKFYD